MSDLQLGQVVATPAALSFLEEHQINPLSLIGRHITGDDGDLCAEDKNLNKLAREGDGRVFSSYNVGRGKVWIITEWDRSYTTLLLPDDY